MIAPIQQTIVYDIARRNSRKDNAMLQGATTVQIVNNVPIALAPEAIDPVPGIAKDHA